MTHKFRKWLFIIILILTLLLIYFLVANPLGVFHRQPISSNVPPQSPAVDESEIEKVFDDISEISFPKDFHTIDGFDFSNTTVQNIGYFKNNLIWVYTYTNNENIPSNSFKHLFLIDLNNESVVNEVELSFVGYPLCASSDKIYFYKHDESSDDPIIELAIFDLNTFDVSETFAAPWFKEGNYKVTPDNKYLIRYYLDLTVLDLETKEFVLTADIPQYIYYNLDFINDHTIIAELEDRESASVNLNSQNVESNGFYGYQIYNINTKENQFVEAERYFSPVVTQNDYYLFPWHFNENLIETNKFVKYYPLTQSFGLSQFTASEIPLDSQYEFCQTDSSGKYILCKDPNVLNENQYSFTLYNSDTGKYISHIDFIDDSSYKGVGDPYFFLITPHGNLVILSSTLGTTIYVQSMV